MDASTTQGDRAGEPGRRGGVGRETFELAHALIDAGRKPTEAFARVAEQTGRSAATVATAYYRVARTMPDGAGVRQRALPATSAAPAHPLGRRRAATHTTDLVRALVDAAAALGRQAEQLEQEHARYRRAAAALQQLQRSR